MSIVARCPECEIHYALSDFAPRDSSVYEREAVPSFEKIRRQSRCAECNRVYQRRRYFVRTALVRHARELGVNVSWVDGSVYRTVVLRVRRRSATEAVVEVLLDLVRAFNDGLPTSRCDVGRHGITVQTSPRRARRPTQRQLFSLRSRQAR